MRKIVNLFIEMPVLEPGQQALGDPNSRSQGITNLEKTELRYKTCKQDWESLGTENIYAGDRIEWFKDSTINQVRGFLINPQNEFVGFISGTMPALTKYPNFLGIHLVYVFKQFQGKGNGLAMYQNAIEKFGGIVSDATLTDGSLGVWKSLSKKYPTYQLVANPKPGVRSGLIPIQGSDMSNKMTSTNEPFIMSKNELLDD